MNDQKVQFLPFHAINEFMRNDYRLGVVRMVLSNAASMPEGARGRLNQLIKQHVSVPGFRNSAQAPASLKVKPFVAAFEKSSDVAGFTLQAWADLNPDLRSRAYDLLKSREWELLPPETDRSKLPGFLTVWPKGEDFEALNKAYAEAYPEAHEEEDDVSLMIVWLSGRLPYQQEEDTQPTEE